MELVRKRMSIQLSHTPSKNRMVRIHEPFSWGEPPNPIHIMNYKQKKRKKG